VRPAAICAATGERHRVEGRHQHALNREVALDQAQRSTLPTAIPMADTAVPANSVNSGGASRSAQPQMTAAHRQAEQRAQC